MFKLFQSIFPPGVLVIATIAAVTSIVVALLPSKEATGIEFWVSAARQFDAYADTVEHWNEETRGSPLVMTLFDEPGIERRMLSGFLSGTPIGDLLESHEGIYSKAFLGPVEQIGFLDITDRLHAEGLYEQINAPSFSTMTSRGRIFGIPHDVHPVLLAYRADLVEAAGIDVSEIETWEDYFRVMRPLMEDLDGDGVPDRYLLSLSEFTAQQLALLLLQNDGVFFDENDVPVFASERNAYTLATIMTWMIGEDPVTTEVPLLSSSGHRQQLDGRVIGNLAPDWLLGIWKLENPRLGGKVKLMPLPAFERGGRRTSVWGGSMIGINRRSAHIETAWEVAKHLYISADVAEKVWRRLNIISSVKALWNEPFYHEPDPFFRGQHVGTLYIEAAPSVPYRSSSPYTSIAFSRVSNAAIALRRYAEKHGIYDAYGLAPEALRLLQNEQESLTRLMSRNMFLDVSVGEEN